MTRKHSFWLKVVLVAAFVMSLISAAQTPLHVSEAQGGSPISYGMSVFGAVAVGGTGLNYTFNGTAGDLVVIDVVPLTPALTPTVALAGPDGVSLGTSQHDRLGPHNTNAHLARFVTQTGSHTITVSGDTAGDFMLRLQGRPLVSSTPLLYDMLVEVPIPQNPSPQYFVFDVKDCPTTLTVTNLSGGEPFTFPFTVKLRNEQGQEVALLLGGDAQQDRVTVPANSGRYEVEVLSDDPGVEGRISLLITCADNAPGCAAEGGAEGAAGPSCPPCPSCPGSFDDGSIPACPVMDLTATVFAPDVRGTRLTWNPVPGTDHYYIHMYGLADDDEHYLGYAGAPGDATEFVFDHLWPSFYGYRFVVEAIQGEVPVCSDETTVTFGGTVQVCPIVTLTATATDPDNLWYEWSWPAVPDVDGYFAELEVIMPGGVVVPLGHVVLPPDQTAWDTWLEPHMAPGVSFRMRLWLIVGDSVVCPTEIMIMSQEIPPQIPECTDFSADVTEHLGDVVTFSWSPYLGAERFIFYIMNEAREIIPGHPVLLSPTQYSVVIDWLDPGTYIFAVGPWASPDGTICIREVTVVIGEPPDDDQDVPCLVNTDRRAVRVHVGPGRHRGVFGFMPTGTDYTVIGYAIDAEGNVWWQLDKTQFPGHEVVTSLWVAEADVNEVGDCDDVPQGDVPPVVPDDGAPGPGGGWGPCGSCDTCGHPGECVTSPEGECLWDPATCAAPSPDDGGGDTCYAIRATVDIGNCTWTSASAMLDTVPNCEGGLYLPGTTIQAHAVAVDPKCNVDYWSGCGASGSDNSVTFTATSSCTLVAHMHAGN